MLPVSEQRIYCVGLAMLQQTQVYNGGAHRLLPSNPSTQEWNNKSEITCIH